MHQFQVNYNVYLLILQQNWYFAFKKTKEKKFFFVFNNFYYYPCRLRFSLSSIISEKFISPTDFRVKNDCIPIVFSEYSLNAKKS
jgi:hypothetical protein